MKIGVFLHLHPDGGGVYQYSLSYLQALEAWRASGAPHEFFLVSEEVFDHPLIGELTRQGWQTIALPATPVSRAARIGERVARFAHAGFAKSWRRTVNHLRRQTVAIDDVFPRPQWTKCLRARGIELMLYPVPLTICAEIDVPFVFSIHDLQHRLQPEFPEVGTAGEWHGREYLFRNGVRAAAGVLVDSDAGKDDVMNFYAEAGARPERVHVLPFLPPPYLLESRVSAPQIAALRERHGLPERYFFYPAQFWPHKNHVRLIEALALLRDELGQSATLVLCGSHSGELREGVWNECQELIARHHLETQVRYLGFVPDDEMPALYAGATALVMPTFFGPTNIPVLEAWASGCAVITSDLRGIREQCGDAALLCDPRQIEPWARAMQQLWSDDALRRDLIAKGHARLGSYTPADFQERLVAAIEASIALLLTAPKSVRL